MQELSQFVTQIAYERPSVDDNFSCMHWPDGVLEGPTGWLGENNVSELLPWVADVLLRRCTGCPPAPVTMDF